MCLLTDETVMLSLIDVHAECFTMIPTLDEVHTECLENVFNWNSRILICHWMRSWYCMHLMRCALTALKRNDLNSMHADMSLNAFIVAHSSALHLLECVLNASNTQWIQVQYMLIMQLTLSECCMCLSKCVAYCMPLKTYLHIVSMHTWSPHTLHGWRRAE